MISSAFSGFDPVALRNPAAIKDPRSVLAVGNVEKYINAAEFPSVNPRALTTYHRPMGFGEAAIPASKAIGLPVIAGGVAVAGIALWLLFR